MCVGQSCSNHCIFLFSKWDGRCIITISYKAVLHVSPQILIKIPVHKTKEKPLNSHKMWGSFIYEWVSVREKYTNTRVFISSSVGHTCLGVRYAFFFQTFYFVLRYSWLTMLWYFQGAAKALSHPYTCIHSPPNSPPIPAATWHWAEFPVLASRSLMVLHVKYSNVSMCIPDSLTLPSPILPPGDHQVITECWAEFPGLDSRSLLVLHVK